MIRRREIGETNFGKVKKLIANETKKAAKFTEKIKNYELESQLLPDLSLCIFSNLRNICWYLSISFSFLKARKSFIALAECLQIHQTASMFDGSIR